MILQLIQTDKLILFHRPHLFPAQFLITCHADKNNKTLTAFMYSEKIKQECSQS